MSGAEAAPAPSAPGDPGAVPSDGPRRAGAVLDVDGTLLDSNYLHMMT